MLLGKHKCFADKLHFPGLNDHSDILYSELQVDEDDAFIQCFESIQGDYSPKGGGRTTGTEATDPLASSQIQEREVCKLHHLVSYSRLAYLHNYAVQLRKRFPRESGPSRGYWTTQEADTRPDPDLNQWNHCKTYSKPCSIMDANRAFRYNPVSFGRKQIHRSTASL